jgi:hypothetical protein
MAHMDHQQAYVPVPFEPTLEREVDYSDYGDEKIGPQAKWYSIWKPVRVFTATIAFMLWVTPWVIWSSHQVSYSRTFCREYYDTRSEGIRN